LILPHFDIHEGNGPPLLMVHGFLSSRAQWFLNLEALKTISTPVVVELFGHGRSVAPEEVRCYHPDYYVEVFEEIRRSMNVARWNVLGHSLGAALTIRYCLYKPESVISQMFTNSSSAFAETATTQKVKDEGDTFLARFEQQGMEAVESIAVHPKNARQIPQMIKAALLQDCALLDPPGVARTMVYTYGNASVRTTINTNSVPALLLCGEKEKRFSVFRNFAFEQMPLLNIVNLPAGHAVNMEAPDAFNAEATRFLNSESEVK